MAIRRLFVLTMFVLLAACGVPGDNDNQDSKGDANHMKTEPLQYTVREPNSLPPNVKQRVAALRDSRSSVQETITEEGKTYFIITLGERPTGGYSVHVSKIEQQGSIVHVYAHEKTPSPGSMVIQVISYPLTVVSVKGDYASDDVKFHITYANKQ